MNTVRQLYITVAGYGCTITEGTDGVFTATCEPAPGTRLTVNTRSLETAKLAIAYAVREYEAKMLDKETTLQEIPTED